MKAKWKELENSEKWIEVRLKNPRDPLSDYELTGETLLGRRGFYNSVNPGIVDVGEGVLKYVEEVFYASGFTFIRECDL